MFYKRGYYILDINSSFIRTARTDNQAGFYVDSYNYNGNVLDIVVDKDIPDTTLPIVTQSKCYKKFVEGDGLRIENEPDKSSREKRASIQGSFGIAIEDVGYCHTYIENLT